MVLLMRESGLFPDVMCSRVSESSSRIWVMLVRTRSFLSQGNSPIRTCKHDTTSASKHALPPTNWRPSEQMSVCLFIYSACETAARGIDARSLMAAADYPVYFIVQKYIVHNITPQRILLCWTVTAI